MEFCKGGNLEAELNVRKLQGEAFTFRQFYSIFKQLINGYDQLYRCGILHQDLKPANIFISNNLLKIGNFGLSYKLSDLENSHASALAIKGSAYYTAP